MSHPEQREYIKTVHEKFPEFFSKAKVLEVGSLNINGSVRQFFSECDYIGIDVGPGRDVDIVCAGQYYGAPNDTFDTVISCECFEHNPFWVETFNNMHRMVRAHGLVVMTCATTGRPEHGTKRTSPENSPLTNNVGWGDYYQNLTEKDFVDRFNLNDMFEQYEFSVNTEIRDLYFWGIKKLPRRLIID